MRFSRAPGKGDFHVRIKTYAGPPRFAINVTSGMREFRSVEGSLKEAKRQLSAFSGCSSAQ
jgi:hypothetical protein